MASLNLYRRHTSHCAKGYELHRMTSKHQEDRREVKKCTCPIYASGTLNRTFKRRNTQQTTWEDANAIATAWESAGCWEGELASVAIASVPSPANPTASRVTIRHAIAEFLKEQEQHNAHNTLRSNTYLLKQLQSFADHRGYVMIDQWSPTDVRAFRASWTTKKDGGNPVAPTTEAKNMGIVKAYFQFCVDNDWLPKSPARAIKQHKNRERQNIERLPFTDDELKRMYDACATKYAKEPLTWRRKQQGAIPLTKNYRYTWTGDDLADFISLSTYTGLRISDVATFTIDRLLPSGECEIRTTKTGRKVYTWLPDWLQTRLRDRVAKHGNSIFGSHTTTDTNVIADLWRRKLNKLWSLCGPWEHKPTPHRFRHTFARILLQKTDVSVRDVAELLGDTEQMVLKHYSAWVNERQARLTKILKDAFADKPKPTPNVVAIR